MKVLGVNALFHDPSAALVVDGTTVAATEEERFSRRKHGHRPVPFAAWELPDHAIRWCLEEAGLEPGDLDAVAYSYDCSLARPAADMGLHDPWDSLRQAYASHAPDFLTNLLPGLDRADVRFVPHHVAHAASAALASPYVAEGSDVLVLDGRGERHSHLAGRYDADGSLTTLRTQDLPHSLGLVFEELTEHLGFLRANDEYKVMALASYGKPLASSGHRIEELTERIRLTGDGGFITEPIDWSALAPRLRPGEDWTADHADLAASVQLRFEEVLVELARWLRGQTGGTHLTLAGGVALNCVANTVLVERSGYENIWVQPAAGDAGTALGAALQVAADNGDRLEPMPGADLGRGWAEDEIESVLRTARVGYERPDDLAATVADTLAGNGIVAWFQGRSEFGPRALGHRSLLAHPGRQQNLERINDVKGREQFRPVAPMVLAERAADIFERGPLPSPYMLFVHDVAAEWHALIPAVTHVDGTARVQTVDPHDEPLVARMLAEFEARTGLPVVINTSLNTAGRPMVDSPRDALECFGSAPIDLLAIGPFVVRRSRTFS